MLNWFKIPAVVAALLIGAGGAHAETLRFAHPFPDTDTMAKLALDFKQAVESKTNNEVTIQIFGSGQLGNDQQMIDGARNGIIDIVLNGLNNYTGLVPVAGALELPFMFPTRELAYRAQDGEPGKFIGTEMESRGLKLLGFGDSGYRNMTNDRGPIRKPEDVRGIRMRVNNSKALNDMFSLLGANPQQLPVAELYTALETGVVDAQEQPLGVLYSFHFNDHQKYLSLTQHAYGAQAFTMSKKKFDQLSGEQQKAIVDAAQVAVRLQRERAKSDDEKIISELEGQGMSVNRDVDVAAFQAVIKPVWDNFIAENGNEIIELIQASAK